MHLSRPLLALTTLSILNIYAFSYTDLGVWGTQYDIEESFEFKEPTTPILSDEKIEQAYSNALKSSQKLPDCSKTADRIMNPTVILDHDINMPKYNVFVKKGTAFNYLEHRKMQRYMIMVNGSDPYQIEFAKHYLPVSDIVIYNGSTEAIDNWSDGHVYIAEESFQKAFKVECLPSVYVQNDNRFNIREYNIKELISGDSNDNK
ncbi:hypothetical protein [Sulfurospirillum multivorans]|uniref:Type-F conjugative transfer system protein, TraW-like n=2 Tax=Sulfurospirillum multivorans TaxID=66821 RepID=A0AA86DYB5_SULMK|nr:hypothetical protein [Sulfurospirillum multivorans]AHJ13008.1 putative type-F conjugative transfer system protein, TraW-like [Sulfurospirillum multivorans DSM 12446]QEH06499.1 putative type-F conjugative transfer system protein, TraW-like [Sulfurospirillum multivorans]